MEDYTFKVNVLVPGKKEIILSCNDPGNCFDNLKLLLIQRFDFLKDASFTIFWLDNDGVSLDGVQIAIRNEADLRTFMESKRTKIFVTVSDSFSQKENETAVEDSVPIPSHDAAPLALIHIGVCCAECGNAVRGYRYKCVECANYDLCFACEKKKLHGDHIMIRLVNPLNDPLPHTVYTIVKRNPSVVPILYQMREDEKAAELSSARSVGLAHSAPTSADRWALTHEPNEDRTYITYTLPLHLPGLTYPWRTRW